MKRIFFVVMAMVAVVFCVASAHADKRDLLAKSSAVIAAEIEGLGSPDAKFLLGSLDMSGKDAIDRIAKESPVGDQGGTQVVQRSYGCSSGCSSGCSYGCSSGCSYGCSSGCSVGCR